MQMILNEMTATRAAAPPSKAESNKFGDNDKSFQDSLDAKVQSDRDNKKASDDQEKAAVNNAASAAGAASTTPSQTPVANQTVDQAQVALELEAALSQAIQDANSADQQAVKALTQDAQQMNVQVEKLVFDLNPQDAKVDPLQTPENQVDVNVELQANSQNPLQLLAQQEVSNKAIADLSIAESETKTLPDEEAVDKSAQKQLDKEALNAVTTTQASPSSILEQLQSAQKKTDETSAALILNQVTDQLKTATASNKDTLKIQLQPENLGKVDVRIVRGGNDGIQFYFTADTPSTSRLLQANLNQLQQSLMEAGVKVGNMSVSYQGQPGQQNNNGQSQRKNGFSFFAQDDAELAIDFQSRNAFSALDTIA